MAIVTYEDVLRRQAEQLAQAMEALENSTHLSAVEAERVRENLVRLGDALKGEAERLGVEPPVAPPPGPARGPGYPPPPLMSPPPSPILATPGPPESPGAVPPTPAPIVMPPVVLPALPAPAGGGEPPAGEGSPHVVRLSDPLPLPVRLVGTGPTPRSEPGGSTAEVVSRAAFEGASHRAEVMLTGTGGSAPGPAVSAPLSVASPALGAAPGGGGAGEGASAPTVGAPGFPRLPAFPRVSPLAMGVPQRQVVELEAARQRGEVMAGAAGAGPAPPPYLPTPGLGTAHAAGAPSPAPGSVPTMQGSLQPIPVRLDSTSALPGRTSPAGPAAAEGLGGMFSAAAAQARAWQNAASGGRQGQGPVQPVRVESPLPLPVRQERAGGGPGGSGAPGGVPGPAREPADEMAGRIAQARQLAEVEQRRAAYMARPEGRRALQEEVRARREIASAQGRSAFSQSAAEQGLLAASFQRASEAVGALQAKMKGATEAAQTLYSTGSSAILGLVAAASPSAFSTLEGSFTALAIEVGAVFLPVVRELSFKVQDAAEWFRGLSDATKDWVGYLGSRVVVIAGVALALSGA